MSNDSQTDVINAVIENLSVIVSDDGGNLRLVSYDAEASRIVFSYAAGTNPNCSTCSFDADTLQLFLGDALSSNGLVIEDVRVETVG